MTLTRDQILDMPAGREMDAKVAEILGETNIKFFRDVWTSCVDGQRNVIRHYSTQISDAFSALYKWLDDHPDYAIHIETVNTADGRIHDVILWGMDDDPTYDARDKSLPLSICRAALLAVMEVRE